MARLMMAIAAQGMEEVCNPHGLKPTPRSGWLSTPRRAHTHILLGKYRIARSR
jgi:hypothetical protein